MSDGSTIPSLLATLIERLQGTETLELEFKLAQGGLPKSLWPTVSAFANTCGGWIVLGIGQDESGFKIQGLNNASQLLDDFYNCLRNPQKINHPVCGARDAHVEVLGSIEVIVIRIPETSRQNRPVYINGNPYQGTYLRRYTGDHHCTKPEVDRMMREASDVGADSAILPDYNLEDIDLGALNRYRRMDQTLHPAEPRITYDDQRYLTAIGAYNHHRETKQEGLTVAGLLLLGTDKALREWRSRHLIDYRLVLDERDMETRWNDRLAWEGHLFGAFEKLYPRLTEGLATGFQLQGATRLDEGAVQTVIREALVNLLVHADYADREVSLIIRTPSSFLFRNPGSLRIPAHREHQFRWNVNSDSGDREQRFRRNVNTDSGPSALSQVW